MSHKLFEWVSFELCRNTVVRNIPAVGGLHNFQRARQTFLPVSDGTSAEESAQLVAEAQTERDMGQERPNMEIQEDMGCKSCGAV
jgi:hypothetical protein